MKFCMGIRKGSPLDWGQGHRGSRSQWSKVVCQGQKSREVWLAGIFIWGWMKMPVWRVSWGRARLPRVDGVIGVESSPWQIWPWPCDLDPYNLRPWPLLPWPWTTFSDTFFVLFIFSYRCSFNHITCSHFVIGIFMVRKEKNAKYFNQSVIKYRNKKFLDLSCIYPKK